MARIAAGDEQAFADLALPHLRRITAVARRVLGDHGEADDVAQETLVRLWNNAGGLAVPAGGIGGWLARVASNLSIDRLRQRRPLDSDALEELSVEGRHDRSLQEADLGRHVRRALDSLPGRQRLALTLFHYEELSMKETADIMETTPEAVESLLGRARRQLKADLAAEWRQLLPDERE